MYYGIIMVSYHYGIIQSSFTALKILSALLFTPNLTSPVNHWCFTISIILPFPECHIVAVIQYVAFADLLLSLSNICFSFLLVFSWLDSSFLFTLVDINCMNGLLFFKPILCLCVNKTFSTEWWLSTVSLGCVLIHLCLTLCDPVDCSLLHTDCLLPPSVYWIL